MTLVSARPRTATFQFSATVDEACLVFVRHLLEGRLVFPASPPMGELHRQTVERVAQMLPRGLLRFLAYGGGWRARPFVLDGRVTRARLWDTPELRGLDLQFGQASLQLLLRLFEAGPGAIDGEPLAEDVVEEIASCLAEISASGRPAELLLQHLVTLPFARHARPPRALISLLCRGNGLNQLTAGMLPDIPTPPAPDDVSDALRHWGWSLAWVGAPTASWWARAYHRLFSEGLDGFTQTAARLGDGQALVVQFARAHDQPAVLGPLFAFYATVFAQDTAFEKLCEPLEWLVDDLSLRARQEHRAGWVNAIDGVSALGALRQEALREHPLSRDDGQRWLLATWESLSFDAVAARVDGLRAHLLRVVH